MTLSTDILNYNTKLTHLVNKCSGVLIMRLLNGSPLIKKKKKKDMRHI